jgi:hypothetical protein
VQNLETCALSRRCASPGRIGKFLDSVGAANPPGALRGGLEISAVKAPGFDDRPKAMLEDIAILAGGVLPKDYNCPALDKVMLGELIDLVTGIATGEQADKAKDILDRVYEYLLLHYVRNETVG